MSGLLWTFVSDPQVIDGGSAHLNFGESDVTQRSVVHCSALLLGDWKYQLDSKPLLAAGEFDSSTMLNCASPLTEVLQLVYKILFWIFVSDPQVRGELRNAEQFGVWEISTG